MSTKRLHVWLKNGGDTTLLSYGSMANIFRKHSRFFFKLELYYETNDYIFVHAGVKPNVPLYQQHESDLLWIRDAFLSAPTGLSKCVVHGHSRVSHVQICSDKINVDTGAVYGGALSAIELPSCRVLQFP